MFEQIKLIIGQRSLNTLLNIPGSISAFSLLKVYGGLIFNSLASTPTVEINLLS